MPYKNKEDIAACAKRSRQKNKDKVNARNRAYYYANHEKIKAQKNAAVQRIKDTDGGVFAEKQRKWSLDWYHKNKHLITPEKKAIRAVQNNIHRVIRKEKAAGGTKPDTCEVCGDTWKICFDHCHTTGKFRGWLCGKCNAAIGMAKENMDIMLRLVAYLDKFNTKQQQVTI
jgi:hypothetical protein